MELDYKPKEKFEGVIRINMPRHKDRIKMIRDMNLNGAIKDGQAVVDSTNGMDSAIFMSEKMEQFIISVNVKHIESGTEIKTLEELECFSEGVALINEVGGVIFNGVSLGK